MYTKTEIFQDIVAIISNDYAGFLDKKHVNCPNHYRITDEMDEVEFVQTVQSYLLDFKDGHLIFTKKNDPIPFIGFKVRRFQNALYVTELQGEQRLQIGDEILALDGCSIEEFANEQYKILTDSIHERQSWNIALRLVDSIKIQRNHQIYEIDLKEYPRPTYFPEYSFKQLNSYTNYIKITDFTQSDPIQKIVQDNFKGLSEAPNLIIDVRLNIGGNDLFYFPLLDYLFDQKIKFSSLFESDEVSYINFTENNCNLWINTLKNYLQQPLDAETKQWIEMEIKKYQTYSGQGLLSLNQEIDYQINGREYPKNVYILSDVTCGSSGDTFVKNTKKSPKVTVVGRATMGIIDYFNVVTKDYGDYEFVYSTSKLNEKYHCNETGVLPHIHIPWTPEHLKQDVDVNYVLNLCKSTV